MSLFLIIRWMVACIILRFFTNDFRFVITIIIYKSQEAYNQSLASAVDDGHREMDHK